MPLMNYRGRDRRPAISPEVGDGEWKRSALERIAIEATEENNRSLTDSLKTEIGNVSFTTLQ